MSKITLHFTTTHDTVDKLLNTINNAIRSNLEEIIQYKDDVTSQ